MTVQLWIQLRKLKCNHVRMNFTEVGHNHPSLPPPPRYPPPLLSQPVLLLRALIWRGHICSPRTAPGTLPAQGPRVGPRKQDRVEKSALDLESEAWVLILAPPFIS